MQMVIILGFWVKVAALISAPISHHYLLPAPPGHRAAATRILGRHPLRGKPWKHHNFELSFCSGSGKSAKNHPLWLYSKIAWDGEKTKKAMSFFEFVLKVTATHSFGQLPCNQLTWLLNKSTAMQCWLVADVRVVGWSGIRQQVRMTKRERDLFTFQEAFRISVYLYFFCAYVFVLLFRNFLHFQLSRRDE